MYNPEKTLELERKRQEFAEKIRSIEKLFDKNKKLLLLANDNIFGFTEHECWDPEGMEKLNTLANNCLLEWEEYLMAMLDFCDDNTELTFNQIKNKFDKLMETIKSIKSFNKLADEYE